MDLETAIQNELERMWAIEKHPETEVAFNEATKKRVRDYEEALAKKASKRTNAEEASAAAAAAEAETEDEL